MITKALKWLVSVLSERDGSGSASRVALLIVIVSTAASLLIYLAIKHDLPSADVLSGMAKIIAAAAALYGANAYKNASIAAAGSGSAPDGN
jgi:hypothetical protein